MSTIFTVQNSDLGRLNPEEAVGFFGELLWAEARRIGLEINKINVSSWINMPDGGIDVSIELVEEGKPSVRSDFLKASFTSYQIKTGTSFRPWQDSQVKKELFNDDAPAKENLDDGVRNCLNNNGIYTLVCFNQDPSDKQRRKSIEIFKNYFKQCEYEDPKVELWSQNNLISFLKRFPSLALKATGRDNIKFQSHRSWSQDAEMKRELKVGSPQQDFIATVQSRLRENNEAIHIRVWGEPGIGKTRLVCEATSAEDISPSVIYSNARNFRDSELMNEILKEDNEFTAILVIDECDPDSRSYIWDKLKYRGPRIKIISIYNDYEETSGNINYLNIPPLGREEISSIIQTHGIPKNQADRWSQSDLCSGSPRVAHVIGLNLVRNPEDLLKSPDTVNIWERYIVGGDNKDSQEVKQRRTVLHHIALFKRFGYGVPFIEETKAIAGIIKESDPQITLGRFNEIIHSLKKRRILQGETTLYITPKALHIKLWTDWWEVYGLTNNYQELLKDLPKSLQEWSYEMFKYAPESGIAGKMVKELLSENGPFLK